MITALVVLFFGLRACFAGNDLATREPPEKIDAELTLNAVTLEQPDEDGKLLWRLKAKSVNYVPDTQRAELVELEGEFFQDGEAVYTIEADEGEVLQNGDQLFLRGNLIAKGTENELTLEGEKLKWLPRKDLLVMGEFEDDISGDDLPSEAALEPGEATTPLDIDNAPVTGFNPQIKTVARLIRVNNRKNEVELLGDVLAESKASPWITFESTSLLWLTQQQLIKANQSLKVEQFASDAYQTVTDRIVGQEGEVDLAENTVTLDQAVTVESLTQPLIVESQQAIWDVDAEMVEMNSPVNIEQPSRQVTAQAQQASLDLAGEVVYLTGSVRAYGEENDSRLAADSVTWQTQTQQVEAIGNVQYQQAADPDIAISGPRAVGDIEAGTLVIEGGASADVVTEIMLDDF
ncbi:MAG: LPS export ABC transporter periplasmic protein LptC [Cyanobacteria bacterium J06560_6]